MRKLRPGVVYNPFTKWPRNFPCFCGSGVKFKKCHESKIDTGVSEHQFNILRPDFEKMLSRVQRLYDEGLPFKLQKPLL